MQATAEEKLLDRTIREGQQMARELPKIFSRLKFDEGLIGRFGVVCTYVGSGPEIVAFRDYQPPVFVASEPIISGGFVGEEPIKSKVLSTLTEETNIQLVRGFHREAFDVIRRSHSPVAVVTAINMFPEWFQLGVSTISLSKEILTPGGLALMSLDSEGFYLHLQEVLENPITGMTLEVLLKGDDDIGLAGGIFLAARRTE